jgi:hypothetical protein
MQGPLARAVFEQGDIGDGGIGRDQFAEVLVRSLMSDAAIGWTFELFAGPGRSPTDCDDLFEALTPDAADALDGAASVGVPSVDDEPSSVREDSLASGDGGDVCRDPDPRAYGRTTTRPQPPSSSTAHCQCRLNPARCRPLAPSTRAEGCLATDGVLDEAAWRGVRTQPRA